MRTMCFVCLALLCFTSLVTICRAGKEGPLETGELRLVNQSVSSVSYQNVATGVFIEWSGGGLVFTDAGVFELGPDGSRRRQSKAAVTRVERYSDDTYRIRSISVDLNPSRTASLEESMGEDLPGGFSELQATSDSGLHGMQARSQTHLLYFPAERENGNLLLFDQTSMQELHHSTLTHFAIEDDEAIERFAARVFRELFGNLDAK